MTVKVEVIGVPEVQKFLNSKNKKFHSAIAKAMMKSGFFIEGEVKQSIAGQRAEPRSVDTGRFMQSVKGTSTNDSATISSDVEYAKHLEYGTSKMRARQHFRNTKFRNQGKVKEIIEREVKGV